MTIEKETTSFLKLLMKKSNELNKNVFMLFCTNLFKNMALEKNSLNHLSLSGKTWCGPGRKKVS